MSHPLHVVEDNGTRQHFFLNQLMVNTGYDLAPAMWLPEGGESNMSDEDELGHQPDVLGTRFTFTFFFRHTLCSKRLEEN